jgi:hypothetical protein
MNIYTRVGLIFGITSLLMAGKNGTFGGIEGAIIATALILGGAYIEKNKK